MSIDSEAFTRYAKAERELCEKAGTMLSRILEEIQDNHGIVIAEIRITMDRAGPNGWSRANCVLVREAQAGTGD